VNDLLEYLRQEMRWGCSSKNMGTTNSHIKKLASETSLGKRDISAFLDVVEEVLEYDGMMHASRLDYKCIRSSSLDERSSPILSKSPSFLFPNIESTALMQPTMSSLTGPLVLISSKITFKRKLKLRRFSKSPMEYQLSRDHFKRLFSVCCSKKIRVDLDEVFDWIDNLKRGFITFQELVVWLSIFQKGTIQDKLQYTFQMFDTGEKGYLDEADIESLFELLRIQFHKRGKGDDNARKLVNYLEEHSSTRQRIYLNEWINVGERVGLVNVIFGIDFLEMMDHFYVRKAEIVEEERRKNHALMIQKDKEGQFSVLMPELRKIVFSKIQDFQTLITSMRVNKRWKVEMECQWYELCKEKYLEDESFWKNHARKSWKWIFWSKYHIFKEGVIKDGVGTFASSASRYEGEWKKDERHGWGKIAWTTGGYYIGQWFANAKQGFGFQSYGGGKWEGDTYSGYWRNSSREGKGTYLWNNGDRYEGYWKAGKKEGKGVFFFSSSGNRYDGLYKNDKRNGEGTFHWSNGDIYCGMWVNGVKQGMGTYRWETGQVYIGEWKKNERYGRGTMVWPNGANYEGSWQNNKFHGKGTFSWPDGDQFEGNWDNNRRQGHGIFRNAKKQVIEQNWMELSTSLSLSDPILDKFPNQAPQN